MGSQKMTFGRVGSLLVLLVLTGPPPPACWCSALPPDPPQVGVHTGPAPVYSRAGPTHPGRSPATRRSEAGTLRGSSAANQGSHNSNNQNNVITISNSNIISNFNTNDANVVNILPWPG